MRSTFILTAAVTVGLMLPANAEDMLMDKLSGAKLVNDSTTIRLRKNGALKGDGIDGAWTVRNGEFCRTLTKPERLAGTECQTVQFDGDQVTFISKSGRTSSFTLK